MPSPYRTHTTRDLSAPLVGHTVRLAGWVHVVRAQSKIIFIVLRDREGTIQSVVLPDAADAFAAAKKLCHESVIALEGTLVSAEQAPRGLEVHVQKIDVLSAADPELPMPIVDKGTNEADQTIRLDYRWLDLRKPAKLLTFKIWTAVEEAFREYFIANGFLQIHSPKLMSSPSESGAEVFEVKYFDDLAYLAQSPQFYKQMAMAAGFERVFEIGPVFRAEPSFTTRHATEFTGFDFEMSFIKSHQDVMDLWANALVHILKRVASAHGPSIEEAYEIKIQTPTLPFPQFTMAEAKALLKKHNVPSNKDDLSPEEERRLGAIIKEQHGHDFVYVTEYPTSVRPFYHMRDAGHRRVTMSFDLLWKGIEITTGAQREHRYDILRSQATEAGLNLDLIQHYLNFFRYGCPPHGGAGIGPGRMIMTLLNLSSIRESTYIYRGVKRLTP